MPPSLINRALTVARRYIAPPAQGAGVSFGLVALADGRGDAPRTGPASGLTVQGGAPDLDYVPELGWPDVIATMREVANDPQVAKEIRAATLPMLSADWTVEPASDDRRDIIIAQLIAANLYQDTGPADGTGAFGREFWSATPWRTRIHDAARMLRDGFALFHKSTRPQGRFTIFDRFTYILPESIDADGWRFDDADNLLSITRTFTNAAGDPVTREELFADELVIYTWDQQGGNILGRPFLRPMFKPWSIKSRLEHLMIVDKQKTAVGIPYVELPEGAGAEDRNRAEALAKAMRAGNLERLWAVVNAGTKFGWQEGGMSSKNLDTLIAAANTEIARAGVAAFTELGLGDQGGSKGTAGTSAAFSSLMQTAIVRVILETERRLAIELADLNFPGLGRYPQPRCSNIDPFEKTRSIPEFVAAVTALRAIGDIETENEVRRRYGFAEVDPETIEEQARLKAAFAPPSPFGDQARGRPDPEDDRGEDGADEDEGSDAAGEPAATLTRAWRPGRHNLEAGDIERAVERARIDLNGIKSELERLEAIYYAHLRDVLEDMRAAVTLAIAAGKLRPTKPTEVKVPFQAELRDRLLAVCKGARDFGRRTVAEEVARQSRQALARRGYGAPDTRRAALAEANRTAEVTVDLDISNLVQRLQTTAIEEFNSAAAAGLGPEDIARRVEQAFANLTDRQIADMARDSMAESFNFGRNVEITELGKALEPDAIRVEVLDENTCDPCAAIAGARFRIGSPQYFENMPPRGCLGRARCRGFYMVTLAR